MQPVMTFASNPDLRRRMYLAYNTRAYPQNKTILEQLLAVRQEIADVLGFRSWADLATADQMMGAAANVREFLRNAWMRPAAKARAANTRWSSNSPAAGSPGSRKSTSPAAATGTSSTGAKRSTSIPNRCVPISLMRRWKLAFSRPRRGCSRWSSAPPMCPDGTGLSRSSTSLKASRRVGRFYLDMHPREGKDKWFSAAPVVTGVRGRYLPEAALICNFPGG